MNMKPRERVLAAIQHQEPDYVPLALGGGPYGIVDDLYLRLVRHLELGQPVAPFRSGHSISYMDDRLLGQTGYGSTLLLARITTQQSRHTWKRRQYIL